MLQVFSTTMHSLRPTYGTSSRSNADWTVQEHSGGISNTGDRSDEKLWQTGVARAGQLTTHSTSHVWPVTLQRVSGHPSLTTDHGARKACDTHATIL